MSKVTIRTGGIVVGRKNRAFDLDVSTVVLDLCRRGYQVYLRDADQMCVTMLIIRDGVLEIEHSFQNIPLNAVGFSRLAPWAWELELHLSHLDPTLYENRITNFTALVQEEPNAEHTQARPALGAG